MPGFLISSGLERFGPADLSALVTRLREIRAATRVVDSVRAEELSVRPDGTTAKGYRFTVPAFRQICGLLSPGLYRLVEDVAGLRDPNPSKALAAERALGLDIYNAVLRTRASRVVTEQMRVLVNTRERSIEGVFGGSYSYLENDEIFRQAQMAIASAPRPFVFHEATMVGRRFQFRFCSQAPLVRLQLPGIDEAYHDGVVVRNSELAGQSSVHSRRLVIRAATGSAAMLAAAGAARIRLAHTGKNFHQRVAQMLSATVTAATDTKQLRSRLEGLATTPLVLPTDPVARSRWASDVVHALSRYKVPHAIAVRLAGPGAAAALAVGRRASLHRIDLYHVLTDAAREHDDESRQTIESAAYGLLTGRLTLPDSGRKTATAS